MALTLTQIGSEIATEKLIIQAVTDNAPTVTSVQLEVFINSGGVKHTLQHLPILGTTDTFQFEINSIVKDYFASEFLPLVGVNQTTIENAMVGVYAREFYSDVIQGTPYEYFVIIKNITQDVFEIEDFDLTDYDCGDAGSTSSKFLTSSPSTVYVEDQTSVHVSCLTTSYVGSITPKQEWYLQTFLNGGLVGTFNENVLVPTRGNAQAPADKYDISTYRIDFFGSAFDEARLIIRDIDSPFTTRSETKTFKLKKVCYKAITLSWLNEFGCQDTFTFDGNINRVGKYTDSTFKRTRPVSPASTDVGDLVYKSSYNYFYDLFSDRMPESTVQWLSKILINKRAAIQTRRTATEPSKYFPIAIETEETTLEDKFNPETIFRIKFRMANRRKGLK